MEGFVVVTNPRAGSAAEESINAARDELARSGEVQITPLEDPATMDAVLDDLDGRTLVVAGGDGTLHRVVQHLWDRKELDSIPLGLLPLGTGNDFARCVGVPLSPVGAAAAIRFGRPVEVDLLVDGDGSVAVNAAHLGVSSDAPARATGLKKILGRLAYPVMAAVAGVRDNGVHLEISVDGKQIQSGPVLLAAVMNGTGIGGGTPVAPEANTADGLTDVVVVSDPGRLRRLSVVWALRTGRLPAAGGVTAVRGREVEISGAATCHNVDGEVGEPVERRRYCVVPGAWRMVRSSAGQSG